jgi:hypothetical protein
MKKAVLLPAIALLAFSLQAQTNYKVIKVNGSIQYVRTGSQMALGDVFTENEALSFGTPNSRAAVINPEKGRFIITPQSASQLSGARSNFLPAMSNISTRGGFLNTMTDVVNQFSGPIVLLYEASWPLNPYQFPMDQDRYFYLLVRYKGNSIKKKLLSNENSLVFSRKDILTVEGQPVSAFDSPAASLYYAGPNGPMFLSSFQLILPDMKTLRSEAGIIIEELSSQDYNRKVNEITGYLFEFYGKPDKKDVMLFLEKDFGLTK